MAIKEIKVSPLFEKHYRGLPAIIKEAAQKKEKMFRENPFNSRLRTHKLHGRERNVLAFWIDYTYRIKFIFLSNEEVLFLDIGTHEIYK